MPHVYRATRPSRLFLCMCTTGCYSWAFMLHGPGPTCLSFGCGFRVSVNIAYTYSPLFINLAFLHTDCIHPNSMNFDRIDLIDSCSRTFKSSTSRREQYVSIVIHLYVEKLNRFVYMYSCMYVTRFKLMYYIVALTVSNADTYIYLYTCRRYVVWIT